MRQLLYLFLILPLFSFAQLSDNFSDGDFTQNPAWNGDNFKFIVNTSKEMQLNSSGTDTAYLSAANTLADSVEWSFWVKLSFAPSDNNYAKIYLMSDQLNLKGALNGYFIRLGENGSFDSVDLWEQTGTSETKIIDGVNGHCGHSINTLRIKVTRSNSGNWGLFSDTLGGSDYLPEGSVTDSKHLLSAAMGVSCKYTTSNATKFYFDDFYVGTVHVDTIPPAISNIFATSPTQLDVYFTEPVEQLSSNIVSNYSVSDGIGNSTSASLDAANTSLVHLGFSNLFQGSKTYSLTVKAVADLKGNIVSSSSADFVLPEPPLIGDIVINEILPDPKAGGVDFVEIYNRSEKVVDFSGLSLCTFDTIANQLSSIDVISTERKLFYPGKYVVLTTDASAVKNQYYTPNPNDFIEMPVVPAMNIASGIVVLADNSKNIIDRFDYKQSMHFPLLNDTKGVSLERIDASRSTNDKDNWHSAAASVGYATPAFKNSQAVDLNSGKEVTLFSEIFSPDNDGNNDVLSINYVFDSPGYVANVSIYNSNGILLRNLVSNELLGASGAFSWNGINNNGELCPIGLYVIYFQIFNPSGLVKDYKRTAVLAHKN